VSFMVIFNLYTVEVCNCCSYVGLSWLSIWAGRICELIHIREAGDTLKLKLGWFSRRVCEVQLHGDQTFDLRQQKYKVSEELKTGDASALFGICHFLVLPLWDKA
jgi:Hexokinase